MLRFPRLWVSASLLTALSCASCSKKDPGPAPARVTATEEQLQGKVRTNLDSKNPTGAQLARKKKSEATVAALGLPVNETLPVVEDETAIRPRTVKEVVERCLATSFCSIRGESNDKKLVDGILARFSATPFLSPLERKFIDNPTPSKQELADFAWRYEGVHVFLWALGYLPELRSPDQVADVVNEMKLIHEKGPEGLGAGAKLRPMSELLDMNDFYYRLDWAASRLRLEGQANPKANEEIIVERHRALNWLIRYQNQEWDDVTTDT